jgi:phosphate:Na+ symporter
MRTNKVYNNYRKLSVFLILLFILLVITTNIWSVKSSSKAEKKSEYNLIQHSYRAGLSSVVGITESKLDTPIAVQVMHGNKPVEGERIDFLIADMPSGAKGTSISANHAISDSKGMARVDFTIGDKDGKYLVRAYLNSSLKTAAPVTTQIQAMTPAWVMFLIFGLLGGLGLFLYGMNIASDNLQRAAGDKMRVLISKLTKTRVAAVLMGTVASGVLQSSSAATVMLVGFVSAGMMTLTQAIGVTIGSKIGVTITVQVIAFDISKYSLLIVGLGALGIMFGGQRERVKQVGAILLGFGLIFFGLSIMSGAMKPLRGMPEVAELMIKFSDNAGLAILAGTAVTAVIQSAAAMVAVCFVLASQGLLPLEAAIPLSIGGAVGTCATALLASLGSNRDGKRVAIAHLLFSVSAALVFLPIIGPFTKLTIWFTDLIGSTSIIRQIANGFMLFSILSAVVFVPLTGVIQWLTMKIIPQSKEEEPFGPKYINEAAIKVPLMALDQAQKEVEHMQEIFDTCLKNSVPAVLDGNKPEIQKIISDCDKLDILEKSIRTFLTRLSQKGLSKADAVIERGLVYITEYYKIAGKLLSKEVLKVGAGMVDSKINFSDSGKIEITEFYGKILNKIELLKDAFHNRSFEIAERILQLSFKESSMERKLRDSHLQRLCDSQVETVSSSADHLTILAGLNSIREKLDAIAQEIIQEL